MAIPDSNKIYPRVKDAQIVYLKNVIDHANIEVGDFTIYNDFVQDPGDFQKNNVLYHYPINNDRLIIGKFCSIACGAKFFNEQRESHAELFINLYVSIVLWWMGAQNESGGGLG